MIASWLETLAFLKYCLIQLTWPSHLLGLHTIYLLRYAKEKNTIINLIFGWWGVYYMNLLLERNLFKVTVFQLSFETSLLWIRQDCRRELIKNLEASMSFFYKRTQTCVWILKNCAKWLIARRVPNEIYTSTMASLMTRKLKKKKKFSLLKHFHMENKSLQTKFNWL